MSKIELRRANVVKQVDSEDKAKVLESKGFVRTDGTGVKKTEEIVSSEVVIKELKEQLINAGKALETADVERGEAEKELADTKEQLQEAEKKIQALEAELSGTKEQLEAAVKKNKETGKK